MTAVSSSAPVASQAVAPSARQRWLESGPVLPVLVSLALPNMLAMVAAAAVSIGETAYVAALGVEPLAAMAVVFPFVMLMQTLSSGAMGGANASAISRALGAGDAAVARALAWHAAAIGLIAGLMFTLLMLQIGPLLYRALGARGAVLDEAVRYAGVLFAGAALVWLSNTLASIVRGCGEMRMSAGALLLAALLQITLGAGLGLGLGPLPRWGMAGVAAGQLIAHLGAGLMLWGWLRSPRARLKLELRGQRWRHESAMRILRVGLLACLSPLQTVLTVLVLTALVARLGVDALAGYGIGARLEFLLIPIAFAVGVAALPMVGTAVARGDVTRAGRVAATSGVLSAAIVGAIGLAVCIWPSLWAGLFTHDAAVLAHAELYLRWAGPAYAFFGLGLTLYFAAQGAGRVLGPVLGGSLRLVIIAGGGTWLLQSAAPAWSYFALVGVAMLAYGLFTAAAVWRADWRQAAAAPGASR